MSTWSGILLVAVGLLACSPSREKPPSAEARTAVSAPLVVDRTLASLHGDVERGKALVLRFECNRCHDGTGQPAMATERHCTHCHDDIAAGRFGAGTPKLAEWKRSVEPYRYAPSLAGLGAVLRPEWIASFIANPYDVRPNLAATMPRLAVDAAQAADLAAYLTRSAAPLSMVKSELRGGHADAGRALMEAKGCGGCHAFTGVAALPSRPDLLHADSRRRAVELAPDLAHTRRRFRGDAIVEWLLSPSSLKPETPMPSHSLTVQEATDIASYVFTTPLAPLVVPVRTVRLPVLARPVSYAEVERRVLSVTCRHCHGDADVAGGDGGPGNTGGFGFNPRGLDLSTYRSAAAGVTGDDGERHSLFARATGGTPLLVAALIARRDEEVGLPTPSIRGMPLGLPSVGLEEIQIVETWIAQGRPR